MDDLKPGLLIIGGIVIFLVIDKMVRAAMGGSCAGGHGHAHGAVDEQTAKKSTTAQSRSRSPSKTRPANASDNADASVLHHPLHSYSPLAAFLSFMSAQVMTQHVSLTVRAVSINVGWQPTLAALGTT
jgi:hypothetical protein